MLKKHGLSALAGVAATLACLTLMAPRNGSGTYALPAGNPVSTGTAISSTVHNATMADVRDALTASLAKEGQTAMTGTLNLGTNRLINLGNASADTDALNRQTGDARY